MSRLSKTVRQMFVICGLLFIGGISSVRAAAAPKANIAGAKRAVILAFQNYERQVDVSKYHLYNKRDNKAVSNMMTEIATQTSYLFYSGQEYTKVVSSPDGQVRQMKLSYMKIFRKADGAPDRTKIQKVRRKIRAKVDRIVAKAPSGMTKLEKALYFHDYLIRNTAYSDQNTTYCTSEWGVLLKGKGNCQGYAKAYALLLQKGHIPVKFANSYSMTSTSICR